MVNKDIYIKRTQLCFTTSGSKILLNRCGGHLSHECVVNCLVSILAKYDQIWSTFGKVSLKLYENVICCDDRKCWKSCFFLSLWWVGPRLLNSLTDIYFYAAVYSEITVGNLASIIINATNTELSLHQFYASTFLTCEVVITFIHHEDGSKQQKYIMYNENTYYTIFKQKRNKS